MGLLLDYRNSFSWIKKGNNYVMVRSMGVQEREKQRRLMLFAGLFPPLQVRYSAQVLINAVNALDLSCNISKGSAGNVSKGGPDSSAAVVT